MTVYRRLRNDPFRFEERRDFVELTNRNVIHDGDRRAAQVFRHNVSETCFNCEHIDMNREQMQDHARGDTVVRYTLRCKQARMGLSVVCPDERERIAISAVHTGGGAFVNDPPPQPKRYIPLAEDKEMELILEAAKQKDESTTWGEW